MRRNAFILVGVTVLFAGAAAGAFQKTSGDTKALDAYLEAWDAAYNAHDATALSALYAEDADQVLVKGERFKGRTAIEKAHDDNFSKNPSIKVKNVAVSRRFVGPDLVVEDGRWETSGHTDKSLAPKGLYT